MFDVKLYSVTKTGNIKTWRCVVNGVGNSANVAELCIITQTKIDGKEVTRKQVFLEGKNIGKKNETTPYQQAINEAISRVNKKKDQGYSKEIPTDVTKASSNNLGLPKPMLAHPIDKVKVVKFPAYWQPKLDGHRAIVTKQDGKMVMYSRQGKPITSMGHILEHLEGHVSEGQFIDGELYVHGEILQNIGSLIKKKQEGSERVQYWVYDMIADEPYQVRYQHLVDLNVWNDSVQLVPTLLIQTMREAQKHTEQFIKNGYEGGILRTGDEKYLAGFRSRNLLKIKKFDDSEYTIVDVVEGKDRIVNDVKLKVAIFVCVTPDNKRFECTAFGDMFEKNYIWQNRDKYIGKTLTVKHSGYTKEGIPWHPVAFRFRRDI